jgi:hypothetical protein
MIGMDGFILAHNGGLDELAIVLFPLIVGGGVWALTRQKKVKPTPDGGEVRVIRERRQPPPPRQRWGGSKSKP